MRAIAERYGVWVKTVYFDPEDKSQIAVASKQILDEKRSVKILVNSAGINQFELLRKQKSRKLKNFFH